MSNKFFGQYLLELGAISKDQLLLAIDLQKASHLSLGQLGIGKGYLTEQQAKQINVEQQRTDQRFGALAVAMGYLQGKQISELFIMQQNLRKFFGEVLIEQNIMSKSVLVEHLETHAGIKKQSSLRLDSAIYAHSHGKLIAEIVSTTVRLFLRIVKINVQVSDIITDKIIMGPSKLAFLQSANLPEAVRIGFVMENDLIGSVANNFLDLDVRENHAVSQDAVCEFLNIVLGNALASHDKESPTDLSPPEIYESGSDVQGDHQSVFNIVMTTPEQKFVLFFFDQ